MTGIIAMIEPCQGEIVVRPLLPPETHNGLVMFRHTRMALLMCRRGEVLKSNFEGLKTGDVVQWGRCVTKPVNGMIMLAGKEVLAREEWSDGTTTE